MKTEIFISSTARISNVAWLLNGMRRVFQYFVLKTDAETSLEAPVTIYETTRHQIQVTYERY
jgi:hypothetical protein